MHGRGRDQHAHLHRRPPGLQEWLSQYGDYRVADMTFKDGSVLLYLDAAPFAVQG
ncbi:hypothetical protein ACWGA9_28680 [Streptomyces sp. NPDC054950]